MRVDDSPVRLERARRWWRWLRPYRRPLLLGMLGMFASSSLAMLTPPLLSRAVAQAPALEWRALLLLILVLAGQALCGFAGVYQLGVGAARAVIDLRRRFFARLLQAPMAFHDRHHTAELVSALTGDAVLIEQSLGNLLPILAQSLPLTALALVFLLIENAGLTVSLALAASPLLIAAVMVGRALRRTAHAGQAALARLASAAQESLSGLWLIKGLTREPYFIHRFEHLAEALYAARRRRAAWQAVVEALFPLGAALLALVGLGQAYAQLQQAQWALADLVAYGGYLALLASGGFGLLKGYTTLEMVAGAAGRLFGFYDALTEREPAAGIKLAAVRGDLRLAGVSFAYPEHGRGVWDIDLHISPGEVLAIVGPNGAGKTTLLRLLLRLYTPQRGEIYLDQQPASTTEIAAWRRCFAVVTRDPVIFSLSVAENIALGRPDATASEIERAARAVQLHEVILNLPDGYAARVGEGGLILSAGQRQRLALARIFLQDPAIILLDEATHSLDADGQAAFASALEAWAGRKTIVIITHHLSARWPVARVIALEQGRVVSDQLL